MRINTEQDFPKSENSISSRRKEEGHRIQDWGGVGASVMEELQWIPKYVLRDGRMLCYVHTSIKIVPKILIICFWVQGILPITTQWPSCITKVKMPCIQKKERKKIRPRGKGKWRDHNIRPFSITSLLTHTYSRGTTLSVMLRRRTHWLQASLQDIEGHLPILSMPFLLLLHPCCAPLKEVR